MPHNRIAIWAYGRKRTITRQQQQGATLLMAIFIIVVFSALSFTLIEVLRQENRNFSLDVNMARAQNVAISGSEWALARIANRGLESIENACNAADHSLASGNGLLNGFGMSDCRVATRCQLQQVQLTDVVQYHVTIEASGACGRDDYYAEHQVQRFVHYP